MFPPEVAQVRPTISDGSYTNSNPSPTDSTALVQFNADGTISVSDVTGAGLVSGGNWMRSSALAGGAWEARATTVSGSPGAGSDVVGSWLALSSARKWTAVNTINAPGSITYVVTIEIRRVAGPGAAYSATYTLTADVA